MSSHHDGEVKGQGEQSLNTSDTSSTGYEGAIATNRAEVRGNGCSFFATDGSSRSRRRIVRVRVFETDQRDRRCRRAAWNWVSGKETPANTLKRQGAATGTYQ